MNARSRAGRRVPDDAGYGRRGRRGEVATRQARGRRVKRGARPRWGRGVGGNAPNARGRRGRTEARHGVSGRRRTIRTREEVGVARGAL